MQKQKLDKVTLVAVSSIKVPETIAALVTSMKEIDYAEVILISHKRPRNLPENITFYECPKKITSTDQYSEYMLFSLCKFIHSDFALVAQYDGYVIHPEKWDNDFLKYDYIGAPWAKDVHFTAEGVNVRVGNGGFSLRSKKLLNALPDLGLPFSDKGTGYYNEDGMLCVHYRKELEASGIRFAPVEVASRFSREGRLPDSCEEPFGFHRNL